MPKTVSITTEVYCTLQAEGMHRFPGCPYAEVPYLKDPHRHMFHIKAFVRASHDNRAVEFICLKHEILSYLYDHYFNSEWRLFDFDTMSCEQLAKKLITKFDLSRCEVSEDGENGAIVTVGQEIVQSETH